jgi:hypothetical protein
MTHVKNESWLRALICYDWASAESRRRNPCRRGLRRYPTAKGASSVLRYSLTIFIDEI